MNKKVKANKEYCGKHIGCPFHRSSLVISPAHYWCGGYYPRKSEDIHYCKRSNKIDYLKVNNRGVLRSKRCIKLDGLFLNNDKPLHKKPIPFNLNEFLNNSKVKKIFVQSIEKNIKVESYLCRFFLGVNL